MFKTQMLSLDEYLREAENAHGHLCAGQVLGVRLAMLGLEKLGIEDPRGKDRKRLVTFVEIDRCATDAIAVVTGCRLGKRALKFRDWGKMAATFVDVSTGKAILEWARAEGREKEISPELTEIAGSAHLADEDVNQHLALMQAARNARKFSESDAIRAALTAAGIIVENTKDGVRWRRK